ncbi:MAG: hypothetical protein DWQ47_08620 [Acidobacteria bacterium]|nr:MAG: hypothetical protein DWQ32_16720 [Acidobacteriota bacterium]REJ99028.1 MAG: hypothetical protein DWQ38_13260 [Acidobacteriota bacterium]REK16251.1 MAG: hypothetical protein DWQ43_04430 [Acidobacteriota bacterium]REK43932.1 MAG: hypothetical protein DWQ47_08620 [Acidobacteriota bacterium]
MTSTGTLSLTARPVSPVFRFLKFLGSVKFGICLLIVIGVLCLAGILIPQQNVAGFAAFYDGLTSFQRSALEGLGLFNVFHSWYFSTLLAIFALNIILASLDRFPVTWRLTADPNVTLAPPRMQACQEFRDFISEGVEMDIVSERAKASLRRRGFRDIRQATAGSVTYVFGQKGSWNRFGAYAVHVALLVVLFGGSLTAWFAKSGEVALRPGVTSRQITTTEVSTDTTRRVTYSLPFEIVCTDIRQRLIDPDGPITASNTLDWVTSISIVEEGRRTDLEVGLNAPADYRGYRFFHSDIVPLGRARTLTLSAVKEGRSETVVLERNGTADLEDGTKVRLREFRAGFDMRTENPGSDTTDFHSPAAEIEVVGAEDRVEKGYVFGGVIAEMPFGDKQIGGHRFEIKGFERVADQHILFVRRDPGQPFVYGGFGLLALSLSGVFLFSHQRIWIRIEKEGECTRLRIAGDTNRSYDSFSRSFSRLSGDLFSSGKC